MMLHVVTLCASDKRCPYARRLRELREPLLLFMLLRVTRGGGVDDTRATMLR